MEVGEMVIALMCATVLLCAYWAWAYQRAALRVLQARPSHAPVAGGRGEATAAAAAAAAEAAAASGDHAGGASRDNDGGPGGVAVRRLAATGPGASGSPAAPAVPAPATSVLGWEAFCIASTMVLDGTALIGCSWRPDPDPDVPITRAQRAWAMGTSEPETATFVLLLGEDERAAQAYDLLEVWRETELTLRLRPAPVPGAVEVYDGHRRALRACLLAA